jgi:transportin-1
LLTELQTRAPADNPTPALRGQLEPHVPLIVECLIRILLNTSTPKSLLENAAVTIGRLGLIFPELVAVHLGQFGKTWCSVLWDIKDNEEKASAFMGFCQLVMVNPNAILGDLIYLCNAICKWTTPSPELNATFAKV